MEIAFATLINSVLLFTLCVAIRRISKNVKQLQKDQRKSALEIAYLKGAHDHIPQED